VILLDLTGRQVYSNNYESADLNQIQIKIPTVVKTGFYIYQVNAVGKASHSYPTALFFTNSLTRQLLQGRLKTLN